MRGGAGNLDGVNSDHTKTPSHLSDKGSQKCLLLSTSLPHPRFLLKGENVNFFLKKILVMCVFLV